MVRVLGGLPGQGGEGLALAANGSENLGGLARPAAYGIGGPLHVADHRGEVCLDETDRFADRGELGPWLVGWHLRDSGRRFSHRQRSGLAARKDIHDFWKHE